MRKNEYREKIDKLINEQIKYLHTHSKGDEKRLMNQVRDHYKPIIYNLPQVYAAKAIQKADTLNLEWGRGTGKSTFMGGHIKNLYMNLPRGIAVFVGPSYKKIKTEILPSIKHGLEMHGIYEDLHYFTGRTPPRSWDFVKAYKMPDKVDNIMWFHNGFIVQFISQDVPGSGRGINADAFIADECGILDIDHLTESVYPTLRGSNVSEFNNKPFFMSRLYASSTPLTPDGRWFIEMEKNAAMKPQNNKFLRADCRMNMKNLAPGFLKQEKENTIPLIYNAEYLNIRVPIVMNGFYPNINPDIHAYTNYDNDYIKAHNKVGTCRMDLDHNTGIPIHMAIDWGAAINAMVVNQNHRDTDEFRTINNFYALGMNNEDQSDMINKFIEYYEPHDNKTIYLFYDPTGNINTGIAKRTRAEIAIKQLEVAGWRVQVMTHSRNNIEHELKYQLWTMIHAEDHPHLPTWRINKANAYETWVSMTNAQATTSRSGKIKKDKSSERSNNKSRQYATDLSDAIDIVVYSLFSRIIRFSGTGNLPG